MSDDREWLFVGGPPRSGTAILSWVLKQHPEIEILWETHFGTDMLRLLSAADGNGIIDVPNCASRLRLGRICNFTSLDEYDVARAFARGLRTQVAPSVRFFGDKSPQYARDWPMLRNIFPGCRIIFTDRETQACAKSILRQPWGADTYERAVRVVENFRSEMHQCPDAYFVRLEELNATPRKVITEMLEWCNLPTDTYRWDTALAQVNCDDGDKVN